jgi:type II secretory ATPase GspE/PulE/Tfp pilus assembly ATPase PilB-like protein
MLDHINIERGVHIVTIEDPIEYYFVPKKSIINQRELFVDTLSYSNALRSVLREDPDVVFVGEMRDYETVEACLRVAETGHLTFSTLHTNSAAESISRIIDIFPSQYQSQVRIMLSMSLEAVLTQSLLPRADGHPQPNPGEQDPSDLFIHADGPGEVRNADLQPVPGQPVFQEIDHAGHGDERNLFPGGADGYHPEKRRSQDRIRQRLPRQ